MSHEEKSVQIGRVVQDLQDAKIDLAHLQERIATTATAYEIAAKSLTQGGVRAATVESGKVLFGMDNKGHAKYLLGEYQLAEVLRERDAAAKLVAALTTKLQGLGCTLS